MGEGNLYTSEQSGRSKQARAKRQSFGKQLIRGKKGQQVLLAVLEP